MAVTLALTYTWPPWPLILPAAICPPMMNTKHGSEDLFKTRYFLFMYFYYFEVQREQIVVEIKLRRLLLKQSNVNYFLLLFMVEKYINGSSSCHEPDKPTHMRCQGSKFTEI